MPPTAPLSSEHPPATSSGLTYARKRLWLGITGVGTAVVAATAALVAGLPARLLSDAVSQPLPEALRALALPMLAVVGLAVPFDLLGGAVIVRERPPLGVALARWARGVAVQLVVWTVTAALLLVAARAGGVTAALGAFVLLQLALAQGRLPLARLIAPLPFLPVPPRVSQLAQQAGIAPERVRVVDADDAGFVGGWSGIRPRTLVVPARWLSLPDAPLLAVLRRRQAIAASGAHRRGVLGAVAWNTLGASVVVALTGAPLGSAAGVLTLAAGMTLWAFAGVLLLPTPSRAAVFAVDALAARAGAAAALAEALPPLDRWQDDEPHRSAGVEVVFHPVPALGARLARLGAGAGAPVARPAHHLARHALWLGWGTLSPLSRLVHCNVGRPALWAMLPGD